MTMHAARRNSNSIPAYPLQKNNFEICDKTDLNTYYDKNNKSFDYECETDK